MQGVRKALEQREINGVIFGHAGDAHVHVNPLVDVSQADWKKKIAALLEDVVALTARLEGRSRESTATGGFARPCSSAFGTRTRFAPSVW